MDTTKLSQGQMVAAIGGLVLIISLFLDWTSGVSVTVGSTTVSGGGGNAFDVFSGMDIILLIIGIASIALAGAAAMDAAAGVPSNAAWLLALLGVGAIGWSLGWDLENDNAGVGAWLGLVASIAIAYGAFEASRLPRSVPRPRPTARPEEPVEPAAPSGSTGPPTY